ncbi:MAG TPA: peptidoglycan editing factor PgeF [Pyrinomonadaceae bacterium]|nr:peptidoglycan editing factor PgeF [Pyrinomonadaceae bacterium]
MLVCDALESAGFANGFSTRIGGVSPMPKNDLNLAGFDDDTAENIEENRQRFMTLFNDRYVLATAWQEHGDGVKIVDSTEAALRSDERYDALASNLAGVLVGVKTADCVPILLGDKNRGAFAAIHAGWRGTASKIIVKAIAAMNERFHTAPADIVAAIGPAACGRNYEIGEDVIRIFEDNFESASDYLNETRPGHALIDLHAANRDQLMTAGVDPDQIFISSLCTMERTDLFFSYRREKARFGKTGRLLSVIGKLSGPSSDAG